MNALTKELPPGLRRVRLAALVAFALQFAFFITWSVILWSRFSLTEDFGIYWQAWAKINHGHLNPWSSIAQYPFWQDHGCLLIWPIALITHFGLGGLTPLIVQDIGVVSAELIGFAWVLRLLHEHELNPPLKGWMLAAASAVFLVVNPWTYWAISFDVHLDVTLAAPFVVLALRALYYRQYRWLALWSALCLLCGDVATAYVAALGIGGLLASIRPGQRRVTASAALAVAGTVAFAVISHLERGSGAAYLATSGLLGPHNDVVGPTSTLHQVSAVLLHPGRILSRLSSQRGNLWAMISPAGLLGLLSPLALPLALLVAVSNAAGGPRFTFDAFQYAALWTPLVVTGVLTARAATTRRWASRAAGVVLVLSLLNTVAWAVVWLPRTDSQWLRVNSDTAQTLAAAEDLIPHDAEVIASQGVVGRFADRTWVYQLGNGGYIKPVSTTNVYFVIVPYQGIENAQVNQSLNLLGALAGPLDASLVLHGNGVWVFRWQPPSTVKSIDTSANFDNGLVPAWAANTQIGTPVLTGPSRSWTMTTRSRAGGYLVDGAYFVRPLGQYVLRVRLTTTGTVNVEGWNDNGNVLLGRRVVPETHQVVTVDVPVPNVTPYAAPLFRGAFGFRAEPPAPPAGQVLEARVYVPPNTGATVYSVRLMPAVG